MIPILSLIVLVATISTFILAIGAYILYKIRERRGKVAHVPQPDTIPAELITPTGYVQPEYQKTYASERYRGAEREVISENETEKQPDTIYSRRSIKRSGAELKPTFERNEEIPRPVRQSIFRTTLESDPSGVKKKYLRYTKDGYIEPSRDEPSKEEILRWR